VSRSVGPCRRSASALRARLPAGSSTRRVRRALPSRPSDGTPRVSPRDARGGGRVSTSSTWPRVGGRWCSRRRGSRRRFSRWEKNFGAWRVVQAGVQPPAAAPRARTSCWSIGRGEQCVIRSASGELHARTRITPRPPAQPLFGASFSGRSTARCGSRRADLRCRGYFDVNPTSRACGSAVHPQRRRPRRSGGPSRRCRAAQATGERRELANALTRWWAIPDGPGDRQAIADRWWNLVVWGLPEGWYAITSGTSSGRQAR